MALTQADVDALAADVAALVAEDRQAHDAIDRLLAAVTDVELAVTPGDPAAVAELERQFGQISEVIDAALHLNGQRIVDQLDHQSDRLEQALDQGRAAIDEAGRALTAQLDDSLQTLDHLAVAGQSEVRAFSDHVAHGLSELETLHGHPFHGELAQMAHHLSDALVQQTTEAFHHAIAAVGRDQAGLHGLLQAGTDALHDELANLAGKLHQHLDEATATLRDQIAGAIEAKIVTLIEVEAEKAGVSIAAGEVVQVGLSAGPWLALIAAAKTALEVLP